MIEQEHYPDCQDCGRLISSSRQLAYPGTTLCDECAAQYEIEDYRKEEE